MVPTIKNGSVVNVEVAANLAEVSKLGPTRPQQPKAGWTGRMTSLMDGSNFYYFSGKVALIRVQPYERNDKPYRGKKLVEALVECGFPVVFVGDICSDDDLYFKEGDIATGMAHFYGNISRPRHELGPLVVGQVIRIQELAKVPYSQPEVMETYRLITVQSSDGGPG